MKGAIGAVAVSLIIVLASPAWGNEPEIPVYNITGVMSDDALNLRDKAGVTGSTVLLEMPYNGRGLVGTGRKQQLGGATWVEVVWSGHTGWVNRQFLKLDPPNVLAAVTAGTDTIKPLKAAKITTSVPTTEATEPDSVDEAQAAEVKVASPSASANAVTEDSVTDKIDSDNEPAAVMFCEGSNPYWKISISESQMNVVVPNGPRYNLPVDFRQQSVNNTKIAVISGQLGGVSSSIFLQKMIGCETAEPNKTYPYAATAILGGEQVVSGCCMVNTNQ